jgi:hypothetical protein
MRAPQPVESCFMRNESIDTVMLGTALIGVG